MFFNLSSTIQFPPLDKLLLFPLVMGAAIVLLFLIRKFGFKNSAESTTEEKVIKILIFVNYVLPVHWISSIYFQITYSPYDALIYGRTIKDYILMFIITASGLAWVLPILFLAVLYIARVEIDYKIVNNALKKYALLGFVNIILITIFLILIIKDTLLIQ